MWSELLESNVLLEHMIQNCLVRDALLCFTREQGTALTNNCFMPARMSGHWENTSLEKVVGRMELWWLLLGFLGDIARVWRHVCGRVPYCQEINCLLCSNLTSHYHSLPSRNYRCAGFVDVVARSMLRFIEVNLLSLCNHNIAPK